MDNPKTKHIGFYKELYDFEMKRREELDKILSFPISIITALAAGVFSLVNAQKPIYDNMFLTDYILLPFIILFVILIGFCIYNMYKVYFGYKGEYQLFPFPQKLDVLYNDIIEAYNSDTDKIHKRFETSVMKYYIEAADTNANINHLRTDYYKKVRQLIGLLLLNSSVIFILQLIKLLSYEVLF